MTPFSRISLHVMKNGSFMMMLTAKGSGLTQMNLFSLIQRWSFMEEKLGCVLGGFTTVEFFNCNQTLYADLYSQQLQSVYENFLRKRFALVNDNTRPYSIRILHDLGWSVLPCPPYSPDLAHHDFHLFPFL